MEVLKSLLSDTITIFTIMNPLSVGVIMLSLLDEDASRKEINKVSLKSTKAIFIAMALVFFIGQYLFKFFGVSPDGLRVFGGLVLLIMAINMVQGHGKSVNTSNKEKAAAEEREDISVVPLAIPIMVGPGLVTTLLTMSVAASTWQNYLTASLAIVICCFATYIILKRMPYIKEKLGLNGLKVINRVMGLVVGSLAAQIILNGIAKFL